MKNTLGLALNQTIFGIYLSGNGCLKWPNTAKLGTFSIMRQNGNAPKKQNLKRPQKKACQKWFDVRTFGQLFAFSGTGKDGVSTPIRGPVTIQSAFSVEPVDVASIQITKSVSGEGEQIPWA